MWIFPGRFAAFPRRARLGVQLLLGVLLVAGCTAGSPPRGLPSPTPSATSRVTETPSPSPTLSREDQVVEVVRQYFKALDLAAKSGDTKTYEAITWTGCTCRKVVATIRQEYSAGGHDVGVSWTLHSARFASFDGDSGYVQAESAVSAYKTVNADGSLRDSYPAHTRSDLIRLIRVNGLWVVAALYGSGR